MNPIIIAIDFSRPSLQAADYAADMASSLNRDICLVHVLEIPITPFQVPLTELEFTEIETAVQEELEEIRQKLLLRTRNKIRISKELRYGLVDQELEKLSEELRPLAVVMGNAASKSRRFFLGSNTLRMIPDAAYPVLIIPEEASFNRIRNIVIASDLSETYPAGALSFIKEWVKAFTAHCDIVYVTADQQTAAGLAPARNPLQDYLAEFNPQFHYIDSDNAETGILQFVEEKRPDLLIVLPEKHGRLGFLMHTSISKKIVLHAHLPILSVAAQSKATNADFDQVADEAQKHDCSACNGDCKKERKQSAGEKIIDQDHQLL